MDQMACEANRLERVWVVWVNDDIEFKGNNHASEQWIEVHAGKYV
jgi:hypothetical protein